MSGVTVTVDGPSVEVDSSGSDFDTFRALLDAVTVVGVRLGLNTSVVLYTGGGMRIEMKPFPLPGPLASSLPALTSDETNPDATEASQASAGPTTRI